MTTLLDKCRVAPPPAAAPDLTVPLSYLDIIWIHYQPMRRLLFYDYPCSATDFIQTVVPKFKQSLSLTLQNYLPVAGNLLYPSDTERGPLLRYISGDSVQLLVSESSSDFDELVGNHAREADQFYGLVPDMPPVVEDSDYKIVPVLALSLTLFPNRGICLGLANHHALGDASSILGFISEWASINKLDEIVKREDKSLPTFDRSIVKDSLRIGSVLWKEMGKIPLQKSLFPLPTNRVRATFVLTSHDIASLKKTVTDNRPGLVHVSSFVVTVSLAWSCLVKSNDDEVDGDTPEYFIFAVDARERVDPPVPGNYFGNCLGYGMVKVEHEKLAGEEGFVIAAGEIAEEIKNRVNKKNELLKGAETWASEMERFMGIRALSVSGSPRFDLPKVDFGWGEARKLEVVHIDGEKYAMSLCRSREFEGGLEIGMSLSPEMMASFSSFFAQGLAS